MKKILNIIKNNYIVIFCIYFISLFLETTILLVDYPIFEKIFKYTRYFTYLLFLIRLVLVFPNMVNDFRKREKKQHFLIFIVILFLITVLLNFYFTRQKRLLFLMLVLLSSYKVEEDEIIDGLWIMQIVLTMFIVLLTLFGFLKNYAIAREDVLRYSLGFLYTTNLAQLVLFSTLLRFYIKKFRVGADELVFVQIINLFTYGLTYSRTEFIFMELIIIVAILYNTIGLNKKKVNIISSFFTYTYWIYPILSVFLVLAFPKGGVFYKIDVVLSNRLSQTYEVIHENGVTLFGKDIEFIGHGISDKLKYGTNLTSNFVDNEYIQLMLSHGVVFIILFVILLSYMNLKIYKKKNYKKLFVCMIYLMFGILNPRILNLVYSPIPFMIFNEITKKEEKIN